MNREPKLIGKSKQIKNLRKFIKKSAKSDSNVLLLGETGVGKELVARMIHYLSERKDKSFIKANCANLNENLLESELFGYKKGAYTGALYDKLGLIEEANEGTFFFDEIGDITPYLQAKLLSVIEDKELRRLGENKNRKINVRFIFATNKDIYDLIAKGKFRKDLFYRIAILTFYIPPLRKRKEDVPLLVEEILKKYSLENSRKYFIYKDALDKLSTYSFPGSVRELENILKRAIIFSKNCVIKEEDIIFNDLKSENKIKYKSHLNMKEIINVLAKHQGNKTNAAKELGISRVHLYRLLDNIGK